MKAQTHRVIVEASGICFGILICDNLTNYTFCRGLIEAVFKEVTFLLHIQYVVTPGCCICSFFWDMEVVWEVNRDSIMQSVNGQSLLTISSKDD